MSAPLMLQQDMASRRRVRRNFTASKLLLAAMEKLDMANEKRSDHLAGSKPENLKDSRLSPPPSPQSGPPISNEELEVLRSIDC